LRKYLNILIRPCCHFPGLKRILSGVFLSVILGVAQAGTLEISNTSAITFFDYDGQPSTATGVQNRGSRGSSAATSSGITVATYSGYERGYLNGDKQLESGGVATLNGQTSKYGKFDYILGFTNSFTGNLEYEHVVVGVNSANTAPVPEPQTYAMMLAGLGLLGLSIRRRKNNNFD
jgi:hypothetical protein